MRRFIFVMCIILLSGCTNNAYDDKLSLYNRLVSQTQSYTDKDVTENIPFDINVTFEQIIPEEIIYRVTIDNPKKAIRNIKAIVTHDYETKDIYPTTGIFEEPLNLIPDDIDMDNNKVKGVILVGYIDYDKDISNFDGTVKVYLEYNDNDGKLNKAYYEYHQ